MGIFERCLKCLRHRRNAGAVRCFQRLHASVRSDPAIPRRIVVPDRAQPLRYVETREELEAGSADVFARMERGTLELRIHQSFPLAEAANAQEALKSRATTGKLLLIP